MMMIMMMMMMMMTAGRRETPEIAVVGEVLYHCDVRCCRHHDLMPSAVTR
jgi:hypothetical protein